MFDNYIPITKTPVVTCAGLGTIVGGGSVTFKLDSKLITLQCKHTPEFNENVISLSKLLSTYKIDFDHSNIFQGYRLFEKSNMALLHTSFIKDGLYPFPAPIQKAPKALKTFSSAKEWHERLGHVGIDRLVRASKLVEGVPQFQRNELTQHQCIPCMESKSKRAPLPEPKPRHTQPLELTHTDMTGKLTVRSLGGAHYFTIFLDDSTAMSAVYFLQQKSEFLQCLKAYKSLTENQIQYRMYALRLDNAGEQKSNSVISFLQENGMVLESSPAYASQSNGASERLIQELWSMARTMLFDSSLDLKLWAEAISHSNWLRNRLPSQRINMEVPFTKWFGTKPDLSSTIPFGTKGYAFQYRTSNIKGKKFLPRSVFGHFVGMESPNALYRIFVPSQGTINICRKTDFKLLTNESPLPSFLELTSDMSRQRQLEEINQSDPTVEEVLSTSYFTHYSQIPI